jgi:penicillin-binding protein 1A
MKVLLLQPPETQGALVTLDLPSGEIKAMVGGYDFNTSRFNHATQALRQTGSAFKPFIYAAAVEAGLTPDDRVLDAPLKIGDWAPHNYDGEYKGLIPISLAIAESRNIPAVRILDRIGVARAVRMVERLGLPNPMAPFLPSALGATEEPLLAMTAAYGILANQGKRVHPHYIRQVLDRDGRELEHWDPPKPEQVLDPYVASTVVTLMEGVVNFGTAARIRSSPEFKDWQIGGKTGTVNDFTDAWFLGYTPTVSTGVWIGFDEMKTLGNKETGAVAALPIWIDYMKQYLKDKQPKLFEVVAQMPDWIATARGETIKPAGSGLPELPAAVPSLLPTPGGDGGNPNKQGESGPTTRKLPDVLLKPSQIPAELPKEPEKKKKKPGKNG